MAEDNSGDWPLTRSEYYRNNRAASYWRAIAIKRLRAAGASYRQIAEHYLITPERVRQICLYHRATLQLVLPVNQEQRP